jgi:putative NADH-flavin reductase
MGKIVVFGAGGRAGRRVVAEAAARGHTVTAVTRTPDSRSADRRITVVGGDVTDAASVAAAATGHDAAITAAARLDVPAVEFYTAATRALVAGLTEAGVSRLVLVGIGSALEVEPGRRVLDDPAFRQLTGPSRSATSPSSTCSRMHRSTGSCSPRPPSSWTRPPSGPGGTAPLEPEPTSFSYADLAVALVDEADSPRHHRALVAVGS